MKSLLCAVAVVAVSVFGIPAVLADEAAPAAPAAEESKAPDLSDFDQAKEYIGSYADNVQSDKDFKVNEAKALETIHQKEPFFGTWWAILPPLIAIFLALITKEVYSSLFIGIVVGGLLYSNFSFEGTVTHVFSDGIVASLSDSYNVGILIFLVILGAMVCLMNKAGGSAAFGRWAQTRIKSRVGAQLATVILGCLRISHSNPVNSLKNE